jgi:MFS transporter, OPA family, sugar phosphate sensor protein UhpC
VNFLLSLFAPAPAIPEIKDKATVDKMYPYWRYRTLYSIFIGYAFYYFTRKSFTFAMPGLMAELHLDKSQLGLLGSVFSISYGLSKFASGVLSDCSSPRYFMALGLLCTGVCNILFGLSSSLFFFALFWGFNGWFQGFGAPPCIRFLTQWYSHTERGAWWSTWSTSHNIGAFLIPWIVGWTLDSWGWRYAMYIPGCICILGSVFLINRLRDTPQSIGLPTIEKYRDDYSISVSGEDQPLGFWTIIYLYILKNKYIWLLALAYFFIYIVRIGISDWTALFLIEEKEYSLIGASGSVSLFEIGGLTGGLTAGWSSDRLFGARRGPVNILYAVAIIGALFLFRSIPAGYPLLDSMSIFLLGFTVFGPQMLIGVAAAEVTHKHAVATSNGFIGLGAYMGAAVAGYPLGKIAHELGWSGYFSALLICAVIAVIVLLPMWGVTKPKSLQEALESET